MNGLGVNPLPFLWVLIKKGGGGHDSVFTKENSLRNLHKIKKVEDVSYILKKSSSESPNDLQIKQIQVTGKRMCFLAILHVNLQSIFLAWLSLHENSRPN